MADKNDAYYIKKALVEIEIIIRYTKGLSYEEFMSDGRNIDAKENYGKAIKFFFENYNKELQKLLISPFDVNLGFAL